MRTRQTRRDWWPAQHIPALKRYAFIGNSTMYGAGIAPDENLPAHAGLLLNAALPAWPVETVNYGVSGYNLWNSWLGIKPELALFDGLVIALCNNDAEMFSRSFRVQNPKGRLASFEPDDPFGAAFACCFTEIGQTCRRLGVPVFVVFYNAHNGKPMLRMDEVIAGHCAANEIPYFHTLPLYAARNLPREQLVATEGDPHPSSLAHDIVARHLVAEMTRLGWFHGADDKAMAEAPARTAAAVQAMIQEEHFPEDAAYGWALGVLQVKAQLARRRAALGEADDFTPAAAPVRAELEAAARVWHARRRAEALALEIAQVNFGHAGLLTSLQAVRERRAEVAYALEQPAARAALARLPAPAGEVLETVMPEVQGAFSQVTAQFAERAAELEALVPMLGDTALRPLMRLIGLLRDETKAQDLSFTAFAALLHAHGDELAPVQRRTLGMLMQADFELALKKLERAVTLMAWAPRMLQKPAAYTTIEIVMRTSAIDHPNALLTLRADYAVPYRQPFMNGCMFVTDQQPVTLHFRVPLLYAGRITLCPVHGIRAGTPDEMEILTIEMINAPGVRRTLAKDEFHRDERGNLVFPLVFLA